MAVFRTLALFFRNSGKTPPAKVSSENTFACENMLLDLDY